MAVVVGALVGAFGASPVAAATSTTLLYSTDGGATWSTVKLPATTGSVQSVIQKSVSITGQGFDTCEIPSLTSLAGLAIYTISQLLFH